MERAPADVSQLLEARIRAASELGGGDLPPFPAATARAAATAGSLPSSAAARDPDLLLLGLGDSLSVRPAPTRSLPV